VITINISEMIPIAMKHMKNYSIRGTPISETDPNYIDLKNLMYDSANAAQMDLCKVSKIPYVMKVTQNPVTNLLGATGFDIVQHLTTKTYTAQGAKSFHFAVDRPCTLTFEQSADNTTWTALNGFYDVAGVDTAFSGSITISGNTSFVTRKGLLTLSASANYVRITPSSDYPFNSMNRALFAYTYASCADVPNYEAFVPYDLPDNYMAFDKMMRTYDTRQFEENSDFKGPHNKVIKINWYLTGQFDIYMWVYPTVITKDTDPTYEFEVSTDAQALIPYYVAGYAADDQSIGVQLLNQYYAFKENLSTPDKSTSSTVKNTLWGV
jgi:hypothetical protein